MILTIVVSAVGLFGVLFTVAQAYVPRIALPVAFAATLALMLLAYAGWVIWEHAELYRRTASLALAVSILPLGFVVILVAQEADEQPRYSHEESPKIIRAAKQEPAPRRNNPMEQPVTFFENVSEPIGLTPGGARLIGDADGTKALRFDDELHITVVHSDGSSPSHRSYGSGTCEAEVVKYEPIELDGLLRPGRNELFIKLVDTCGGDMGSSGIYVEGNIIS